MANPYPNVLDPERVGTYPAESKAGGGHVWDAVLELPLRPPTGVFGRNEVSAFHYGVTGRSALGIAGLRRATGLVAGRELT